MRKGNSPAKEAIDLVGIDAICERIEAGETYSEIAQSIGVSVGALYSWLNEDTERYDASVRARTSSAEAWLDRGLKTIAGSLLKSGDIDPSAARAYAQECARRAAIRNPQYSERKNVELSGDPDRPIVHKVVEEVVRGTAPTDS